MRSMVAWLTIVMTATLGAIPWVATAEDDPQTVQLLFVQSTTGGTSDGTRLVLKNVGPTLFFTDRPFRAEGHIPTTEFAKNWSGGGDSFAKDPPNAILSILSDGKTENVALELLDLKTDGAQASYRVKILEGTLPASFGAASLFIDHHSAGGYVASGLGGLIGGYGLAKLTEDKPPARAPEYPPPAYYPPQYPQGSYYRAAPPPPCP